MEYFQSAIANSLELSPVTRKKLWKKTRKWIVTSDILKYSHYSVIIYTGPNLRELGPFY